MNAAHPMAHKSATNQPVVISRVSTSFVGQSIIKKVDENTGDNVIELPSLN